MRPTLRRDESSVHDSIETSSSVVTRSKTYSIPTNMSAPRRGRGRPRGSKNKPFKQPFRQPRLSLEVGPPPKKPARSPPPIQVDLPRSPSPIQPDTPRAPPPTQVDPPNTPDAGLGALTAEEARNSPHKQQDEEELFRMCGAVREKPWFLRAPGTCMQRMLAPEVFSKGRRGQGWGVYGSEDESSKGPLALVITTRRGAIDALSILTACAADDAVLDGLQGSRVTEYAEAGALERRKEEAKRKADSNGGQPRKRSRPVQDTDDEGETESSEGTAVRERDGDSTDQGGAESPQGTAVRERDGDSTDQGGAARPGSRAGGGDSGSAAGSSIPPPAVKARARARRKKAQDGGVRQKEDQDGPPSEQETTLLREAAELIRKTFGSRVRIADGADVSVQAGNNAPGSDEDVDAPYDGDIPKVKAKAYIEGLHGLGTLTIRPSLDHGAVASPTNAPAPAQRPASPDRGLVLPPAFSACGVNESLQAGWLRAVTVAYACESNVLSLLVRQRVSYLIVVQRCSQLEAAIRKHREGAGSLAPSTRIGGAAKARSVAMDMMVEAYAAATGMERAAAAVRLKTMMKKGNRWQALVDGIGWLPLFSSPWTSPSSVFLETGMSSADLKQFISMARLFDKFDLRTAGEQFWHAINGPEALIEENPMLLREIDQAMNAPSVIVAGEGMVLGSVRPTPSVLVEGTQAQAQETAERVGGGQETAERVAETPSPTPAR